MTNMKASWAACKMSGLPVLQFSNFWSTTFLDRYYQHWLIAFCTQKQQVIVRYVYEIESKNKTYLFQNHAGYLSTIIKKKLGLLLFAYQENINYSNERNPFCRLDLWFVSTDFKDALYNFGKGYCMHIYIYIYICIYIYPCAALSREWIFIKPEQCRQAMP